MSKKMPSTATNRPELPVSLRRARPGPLTFSGLRELLPSPVILVVCDDSLLRWALYEALVAAHYRVLACNDQAHAREILPRVGVEPSLAIIDDETWPMTQSERTWLYTLWPELPIVALAHHGQGLEHRTAALGLADVLLKPFDIPRLVQTVERLLATPVRTTRHLQPAQAG